MFDILGPRMSDAPSVTGPCLTLTRVFDFRSPRPRAQCQWAVFDFRSRCLGFWGGGIPVTVFACHLPIQAALSCKDAQRPDRPDGPKRTSLASLVNLLSLGMTEREIGVLPCVLPCVCRMLRMPLACHCSIVRIVAHSTHDHHHVANKTCVGSLTPAHPLEQAI